MANQQLINYIKQALQQKNQAQISEELKQAGWQEKSIEEAFVELGLVKKTNLWDIGSLFEKTWHLYTSRLGVFVLIRLIGLAPFFLVIPIVLLFLFAHVLGELIAVIIIFLIIFLFIGVFLMGLWTDVALLQAIKEEEKIGVKHALRRGWSKLIPYIWIKILVSLILGVGFCLPLGIFALILYYLLAPFLNIILVIILAIPLLVILLVPGIILWIWLSLADFAFISEDKKGMAAIYRSKQLVEGKWWHVFFRLFLVRIITFAILMPISFIAGGLDMIIYTLLIYPFILTFLFFIYKDLSYLKSGISSHVPSKKYRALFIVIALLGVILPVVGSGIFLAFFIL